jgi:hypothetical protein
MAKAREVVRELRRQLTMDLPSEARVMEASHLTASHPMAYADAFAVATAVAHNANLLTGDPEILGGDPSWPTIHLRIYDRTAATRAIRGSCANSTTGECRGSSPARRLRLPSVTVVSHGRSPMSLGFRQQFTGWLL